MNDVTEMLRIDGIDIALETVPSALRREYESAQAILTSMPAVSPQKNLARAHLNKIAAQILTEMAPLIALKASPRSYGAHGMFQALQRRG